MTHIEDEAVDKAHGKLSWYCERHNEVTRNVKSLEEELYSERECCYKVEAKLESLCEEVKTEGKQKATPASCKWCEWESASGSDTAK